MGIKSLNTDTGPKMNGENKWKWPENGWKMGEKSSKVAVVREKKGGYKKC